MPANRLAALVAVLAQLAVLVAAIAGVFHGTGDALAAAAALLTKAAVVLKFMDGSQKYDALTIGGTRR